MKDVKKVTKKAKPVKPAPAATPATPELLIVPRREGLRIGHANRLDVLVRIPCPPPPDGKTRPSLNLAYVLDRSGSMAGGPLEEAKRCAAAMIARMGPQDHAALVVYDDTAKVVLSSRAVKSPELFAAALAGIETAGCTNLHEGWLKGAQEVARHQEGAGVSRVILLSDGNANQGLTDTAAIEEQCRQLAAAGVTTSTYGLGDAFNEDLMLRMARSGGGSGYYGQTADDLMEPFGTEFDLMSALAGRAVRLEVEACPGAKVRVVNDYLAMGVGHWLLPDLAWGGETWALLEVEILPPKTFVAGHRLEVLQVSLSWTDLDGKACELGPVALELPLLTTDCDGLPENELVARRAGELEAADYQKKAQEAAGRQAWKEVDALLRKAKKQAANNPWVAGVVDVLVQLAALRDEANFKKEAAYSSRRMNSRIADANENAVCYSATAEAASPSFARRKTYQGRTQFQDPKDSSPGS
jgi:Ca-activated chloride channel family protein